MPLIDNCIIAGGIRGECIEALPPEELAKLEAAEAERGAMRREQMRARRGYDVFGGRREGARRAMKTTAGRNLDSGAKPVEDPEQRRTAGANPQLPLC